MKYQTIFLTVELIHVVAHTVYADGCYLDQAIWLRLGFLIYQNITCSLNIGSLNDDWQGLGCELGGS